MYLHLYLKFFVSVFVPVFVAVFVSIFACHCMYIWNAFNMRDELMLKDRFNCKQLVCKFIVGCNIKALEVWIVNI